MVRGFPPSVQLNPRITTRILFGFDNFHITFKLPPVETLSSNNLKINPFKDYKELCNIEFATPAFYPKVTRSKPNCIIP
jgi:hypothetical protein